ncbi:MAG: hypothetical protein ACRD24_06375 [Terriglobales bacterium]
MRLIAKSVLAGIVILALASYIVGQQAPARKPPAKPAQAPAQAKKDVPQYKVADEIKVKAAVEQVKNYECPISGTVGTHLVVKIDSEKYEAHIAPLKFLEEYGIQLKEGDSITLFGTKVKFGEGPALLVRAIERENDRFFFRDKEGLPLWR